MWLAKRTPKERNFLGLEIRERVWNPFFFLPLLVSNALDNFFLSNSFDFLCVVAH